MSTHAGHIVGLLLAAGSARRFGGDKLLQPLPDGDCILGASARALMAATAHSVALIRPAQHAERRLLHALGLTVIDVPDAAAGMGITLATGIRATLDAAGWVVALADMPCLHTDTLRAVAQAVAQGADLAAPFFNGQRGHPVGFAVRWRDALGALQGDAGARDILRQHAERITRIEVDDPGCLLDIDTPADLQTLTARAQTP